VSNHVVSVLMSVYNRAGYLDEAVRSVLATEGTELDLVLVDDGSTDGSAQRAAEYGDRITLMLQDHAGCAAAWNLALDHARGDLIGFCDSDDVWTPEHVPALAAALDTDEVLGAVFGLVTEFVSPELATAEIVTRAPYAASTARLSGAMLVRRSVFDLVGRFDVSLRQGYWFDWYARLIDAGVSIADVDRVVLHRRLHTGNSSVVQREHHGEMARALHASLVRRRTRP
jgi:glycosyltransferase involved in cell wall biosynthesis